MKLDARFDFDAEIYPPHQLTVESIGIIIPINAEKEGFILIKSRFYCLVHVIHIFWEILLFPLRPAPSDFECIP